MTNANMSYSPSAEHRYFLYDPNDGHRFFRTPEERDAAAEDLIEDCLEDGEWSEQVVDIYAGEVTHQATEVERLDKVGELDEDGHDENGEYWRFGDVDYRCNYRLRPLLAPALPEPADMAVEQLQHIIHREPWATWLRPGGCLESAHCDLTDLLSSAIAADRAMRPTPAEPADHIRNATEMVGRPADGEVIDLVGCVQEWAARLDEGTPEERLLGRVAYVLRQRQAPPHEGEIDALIKILSRIAGMLDFMPDGPPDGLVIHRAIELLRQLAPPAEGEVGELVAWIYQQAIHGRAADLLQEQAAELALLRRQAEPPAEGEAWRVAEVLRRRSAQNPMGSADPTLLRAAELLERLAGELATLRSAPHG